MVKITITEDRITGCDQCGRLAARLSTETARANRAEDALNNSLVELEKAGWPCRLEELPAMYVEVATRMTNAEKRMTKLESMVQDFCGGHPDNCSCKYCLTVFRQAAASAPALETKDHG